MLTLLRHLFPLQNCLNPPSSADLSMCINTLFTYSRLKKCPHGILDCRSTNVFVSSIFVVLSLKHQAFQILTSTSRIYICIGTHFATLILISILPHSQLDATLPRKQLFCIPMVNRLPILLSLQQSRYAFIQLIHKQNCCLSWRVRPIRPNKQSRSIHIS